VAWAKRLSGLPVTTLSPPALKSSAVTCERIGFFVTQLVTRKEKSRLILIENVDF